MLPILHDIVNADTGPRETTVLEMAISLIEQYFIVLFRQNYYQRFMLAYYYTFSLYEPASLSKDLLLSSCLQVNNCFIE